MKQTITIKQLNELNEKGKKKLRKWVEDKDYWPPPLSKSDHQLILSIGQLVEFLDENDDYFKTWYRLGKSKISRECRSFQWKYDEELCDNLWEAVKEALEK